VADPLYRGIVVTAKGLFKGLAIDVDVVGAENIPLEGGALLAINHTSYLDFALGGIPADLRGRRLVRFMAKDSIFRHKIAGPLMRGMKHIPVNRDAGSQAFRDAVSALKAGEIVGVFPEATMSRSLDIKELKSGSIRMAKVAKVPVIPMIIFGGHRILSYGVKDFSRGKQVCITVGKPLEFDPGMDADQANELLSDTLKALLAQTIERYRDKPAGAAWIPARFGGSAPTLAEAEVIESEVRAAKQLKRDSAKRK
jgi:1-acyl-sn-glycerol-3-phosphate acyltransferase